MLVLALEASTSAAKAMVLDSEKGIIRSGQTAYPDTFGKEGCLNAGSILECTLALGRKTAQGCAIAAVAICGIWHSLAVFDGTFHPVTPLYMWNFLGTSGICSDIRHNDELTEQIYRSTGCMPHCTYPRHALQLLKQQGFDLTDKKIMTEGAYLFLQLTGEWMESASTQSGSGLIHLKTKGYDPLILDMLGIQEKQLGTLGNYRDTRPLSKSGAEKLGLSAGIPVVPAHPDGALNQIGNYASAPGIMTLSVGTSAALRLTVREPELPKNRGLWCYCGADDWILGAATAGACSCINWFRDKMADGMSFENLEKGRMLQPDLPVFLPFVFGERCPGWRDDRSGIFCRIKPWHGVEDFYTSVQTGVLFNLYQCYRILEETEKAPEKIIVSGGITNSKRWEQMLADIFGREIFISDYSNASTVGAGALALLAAGAIRSLSDFHMGMDRLRTVEPDRSAGVFYEEEYQAYLNYYSTVITEA